MITAAIWLVAFAMQIDPSDTHRSVRLFRCVVWASAAILATIAVNS